MVSSIIQPTNEITLPPTPEKDDLQQAAALLHRFNALSLGEGDLMAGGNTLAAMAITLANIAPPGSCLVDGEDGAHVPVGMNTLVSGGLSCGLVSDRVLRVLQELQGNLLAHIRQQDERRKKGEKRITEASMFLGNDEKPPPPTVLDQLDKDAYLNEAHFEGELRGLLRAPANAGVSDITDAPVIFAGIGSVEALNSTNGFAHRGRLLAHVNLSGKNAGILLDQVCDEVVSGCPTRKQLATTVRGEVIATDPTGMLDNIVAARSGHGWMERMLWLVDHAAGPEMEITTDTKGSPQLARPAECFEAALEEIATRRLNFHMFEPMRLSYPLAAGQAEWNAFLTRLETDFPGITGTLRPLLASLVFGLSRILKAVPGECRPPFVPCEVEAFARLLALRMVNARAVALHHEHEHRLAKAASYIRMKLREGPHSARDLQRYGNDLDAATCREALARLADAGVVEFACNRWQLVTTTRTKPLTLHA
jgi:hypothetical protein